MKSLFIFLLLFSQIALAQNGSKTIPEIETVHSPLESVDDAIEKMWVSAEFDVSDELKDKVVANADLIEVEVSAIRRLIQRKDVPNSKKKIVVVRYTAGHPEYTKVLVEALEAGIPVDFITDFNPLMRGKFKAEETYNSNFDEAEFKSPNGAGTKNLKALMDAGAKINKNIFSPPLFSEKMERVPIMHEKMLGLFVEGEDGELYLGTNNIAPNPRYNRLYKIVDPYAIEHLKKHIENLKNTFKQGKRIVDTEELPWRKIIYKDGSSQTLTHTNGKYNPHELELEYLDKHELVEFIWSHFVITYRTLVDKILVKLKQFVKARGIVIADDRFAEMDDWGLAIALEGITVHAPFGKPVYGFPASVTKRIDTFVYQRQAIDPITGEPRIEVTEEGPPESRHVYHDKTGLYYFIKTADGRNEIAVLSTGTFNLSNNFHNAETMLLIEATPRHKIVEGVRVSIIGTLNKEINVHHIPALIATIRNALGMITGRTDLEIPLPMANQFMDSILERDYSTLAKLLRESIDLKSNLANQLPREEITTRIETLIRFLDWYKTNIPPSGETAEIRLRRILSLAMILAKPQMSDIKKTLILRSILWRPGITDEIQDKATREGAAVLGFKYIPPKRENSPPNSPNVPNAPGVPNTTNRPYEFRTYTKSTLPKPDATKALAVDWDDTSMYMPTKIVLFEKGTRKPLPISTGAFAEIGHEIGKAGTQWANYELIETKNHNSFEFFRISGKPDDDKSYMKDDAARAMEGNPEEWMGPYFWELVSHLSTRKTADQTYIITKRGHSAEEVILTLEYIQLYLKRVHNVKILLPPIKNIKLNKDPHEKGIEVVELYRKYDGSAVTEIEFADDDPKNVKAVEQAVDAYAKEGGIRNIRGIVTHVSREQIKSSYYGVINPFVKKTTKQKPSAGVCPTAFAS